MKLISTLMNEHQIEVSKENLGVVDGYYLPTNNFKIVHVNHTSNDLTIAREIAYAILFPNNHNPFNIDPIHQDFAERFAKLLLEYDCNN